MRKLILLVFAAVVLLLGAPVAQAGPSCSYPYCDWVLNGRFENGTDTSAKYWTGSANVRYPTITDPCGSFPYPTYTKVAQLKRTDLVSQQMYPDYGTHFSVQFRLFLLDDTESFYDQLRVSVKNLDTGALEKYEIHGNTFNSTCAWQTVPLSNNYNSHNVELKFEVASLATGTFQLDYVVFWSWP
jgi:hypothetical protein